MNPDDLNTNEDIVEAIDENGQETNSILEASLEQSARNGSISEQQLETQDRILQELQKEKEDDGMAGFFSALEMVKGKDSTVPGPKGDKGDKGEQGDTGDQGEKGEQGERGEQGLQGEQGIEGKTGKQGDKGQGGTDGAKGKDGKNGKDGSPDTPKQVKEKLLKQGIGYDELTGLPDIAKIARMSISSKTVSLIELDDVDFSALTKNAEGKYVLGGGGSSDTLYTANGQLTGARTVDQDGHKLSLMNGDLRLGDYPNTRDDVTGITTYSLGTSTESAGMTAGGGATFTGTYTGGASTGYVVTVDFFKGTATGDWSWTFNGGAATTVTGITTASPYALSNGISVTFNGAGTGYTEPATLSAPIDSVSVGTPIENVLYTDVNGNVLSALIADVAPTVDTLYTANGTITSDRVVTLDGTSFLGLYRILAGGASGLALSSDDQVLIYNDGTIGQLYSGVSVNDSDSRAYISATSSDESESAEATARADGTLTLSATSKTNLKTEAVNASTATVGQVLTLQNATTGELEYTDAPSDKSEYIIIGASDETTALTTGTAKTTFRIPWTGTITGVRASVTTAPTDAVLTVDINKTGTGTILSTKITIDATEKTSVTAATAPVISTAGVTDDDEYTIDIDTIGSTVAGAGLKVTILGTRS